MRHQWHRGENVAWRRSQGGHLCYLLTYVAHMAGARVRSPRFLDQQCPAELTTFSTTRLTHTVVQDEEGFTVHWLVVAFHWVRIRARVRVYHAYNSKSTSTMLSKNR